MKEETETIGSILPPIRPKTEEEPKNHENGETQEGDSSGQDRKQRRLKASGRAVVGKPRVLPASEHDVSGEGGPTTSLEPSSKRPQKKVKPKIPLRKRVKTWFEAVDKVRLSLVASIPVACFLVWKVAWMVGYSHGRIDVQNEFSQEIETQILSVTPENLAQVDSALGFLRKEKPEDALGVLDRLRISNPKMPSLDYITALTALQLGDLDRAEFLAKSSLEGRQREADSLVLLGVIAAQRGTLDGSLRLIDPKRESLDFIARAMKVDPASPAPRIEASNAFRSLGKNEEALAELEAARLRMMPVDLLLTVDVTRALLGVEVHGTEGPHLLPPRAGDWPSLFQGALVAMKNNDFSTALMYLEQCREGLPPMTFFYLVSDPSLRKFAFHPEMRSFFQQFE